MSSASASSSIVSELRKTSYERRWKHDRLVAIGLVLVIFAVGVPFWWITTTVYRAELPQTRVNNWKTYAKTHFMKSCPVYHVNIPASFGNEVCLELSNEIRSRKKPERFGGRNSGANLMAQPELRGRVLIGTDSKQEGIYVNSTLSDIITRLENQGPLPPQWHSIDLLDGNYISDLNHTATTTNNSSSNSLQIIMFARRKMLIIVPNIKETNVKELGETIANITIGLQRLDEIASDELVREASKPSSKSNSNPAADNGEFSESDARRMRVYEYTNSYQLTFSLLGGSDQPEDIKDLDWDIEAAMTAYIQPFLDQLEPFAKFITDSQIQRYAKLPVTPQLAHNISAENELPQALLYIGPDGNDYGVAKQHLDYYYLTPKNLTHFISSSEWNLASTETTSPIINMVLYVPPRTHRPLYIHSTGSGDKPIANSAFLVPRWGGFFIHNGNSTTISFDELHTPMSVFVSQLRGLLGVPNVCSELARYLAATSSPTAMKSTIACQSATRSGISGWDLDSLFRRRAVANIASAVSTLDSVSNLLDHIPNIEAPDDIRNLMTLSLDRLDKALESFGIDDGPIIRDGVLDIAMKASGEAAEFAKQAFDHPDLVTQMYFPDEHKLAIYMPLFVPVFMPVIIALVKLFKERRDAKLKKQE